MGGRLINAYDLGCCTAGLPKHSNGYCADTPILASQTRSVVAFPLARGGPQFQCRCLVRADQLATHPSQVTTDLADYTAHPLDDSLSLGWCEFLLRYRVDTMMRAEGVKELVAPTLK